jgi:hypothetical protein
MAEAYGVLPSRLLTEASTFDLVVYDVVMTYRAHQEKKQNRAGGQQQTTNMPGDDNMLNAVTKFRENG